MASLTAICRSCCPEWVLLYARLGKEGVDSVTCYMCNCSIKDWEPSDIPNQVHYENSPNCPVATLRQKPWNQNGTDANQVDIDSHHNPHCESSVLVRLQTYFYPLTDSEITQTIVSQSSDSQYKSFLSLATSFWPHDKKGWKPISLRMALAGFYYTQKQFLVTTCVNALIVVFLWTSGKKQTILLRSTKTENPTATFHVARPVLEQLC